MLIDLRILFYKNMGLNTVNNMYINTHTHTHKLARINNKGFKLNTVLIINVYIYIFIILYIYEIYIYICCKEYIYIPYNNVWKQVETKYSQRFVLKFRKCNYLHLPAILYLNCDLFW